jgi:hypothetical protein
MNLNYGYDKKAMQALTEQANKSLYEHTLVIDFDGEVIIDPERYFPDVSVTSYKFSTHIKDASLRNDITVRGLYDALEQIHEELNRKADVTLLPAYISQINMAA